MMQSMLELEQNKEPTERKSNVRQLDYVMN